jgi:hypothetical protein
MKLHKINDLDYEWVKKTAGNEVYYTLYHTDRMVITKTKHGEFRICDRNETVSIRETLASAKECAISYYQMNC